VGVSAHLISSGRRREDPGPLHHRRHERLLRRVQIDRPPVASQRRRTASNYVDDSMRRGPASRPNPDRWRRAHCHCEPGTPRRPSTLGHADDSAYQLLQPCMLLGHRSGLRLELRDSARQLGSRRHFADATADSAFRCSTAERLSLMRPSGGRRHPASRPRGPRHTRSFMDRPKP